MKSLAHELDTRFFVAISREARVLPVERVLEMLQSFLVVALLVVVLHSHSIHWVGRVENFDAGNHVIFGAFFVDHLGSDRSRLLSSLTHSRHCESWWAKIGLKIDESGRCLHLNNLRPLQMLRVTLSQGRFAHRVIFIFDVLWVEHHAGGGRVHLVRWLAL